MSTYGYITPPTETRDTHRIVLPYEPARELRLLPASSVLLTLTVAASLYVLVTMAPLGFRFSLGAPAPDATAPAAAITWDARTPAPGLSIAFAEAMAAMPPIEAPPPAAAEVEAESDAATYTVVRGDTMAKIAVRLGVGLRSLIEENDIDDPTRIEVGQVLRVPAS